ncbi:MAG: GspMb/PilO family protein [Candidatus Pacebacteria bacterium]|nr:GspMb/PilO family protein [Candidatus Paceibacterota bacterium]
MADTQKLKTTNQQTNFRYIYNTRKYLVWSGVIGLITVVLLFASLIPQINSITSLYDDLLKENKRLTQLKLKVAQLTDSTNSLIVTNSERVNNALPSKKPLLELLTALNAVGSQTKVSFDDISLTPGKISTESAEPKSSKRSKDKKKTTTSKKYETLSVDINVTGKIENINNFLREIENIAPFSTVTAMSLNERSSNNPNQEFTDAIFEAKLTVSTYFFTKSVAANIDAALPELTVAQREIIDALQGFTYTTLEEQYQIRGGGLENLFPGIGSIPI